VIRYNSYRYPLPNYQQSDFFTRESMRMKKKVQLIFELPTYIHSFGAIQSNAVTNSMVHQLP